MARGGISIPSTPRIAGIEEADALLIIGSNPRLEAPVLNARIRKRVVAGNFPIGFIGPRGLDLTYGHDWLGEGGATLRALAGGSHRFNEVLRDAKRPMLILGRGALSREDGAAVLAAAWQIAAQNNMLQADWHGFNLLHQFGGQVAPLDLGFLRRRPDRGMLERPIVEGLWLLGAELPSVPDGTFVVYQGHHGEAGASAGRCDPARRGLYREGRDLGQYRGPGPARPAGGVPAGRGTGGLEDHPCRERGARRAAALRLAGRAAGAGWSR